MAPHHSPDDALLSRLTRAGVRLTLQAARELLAEGEDWGASGVLEHKPGKQRVTVETSAESAPWTRPADEAQLARAGLAATSRALWHELAAWVKPPALVHAWLSQPLVRFAGGRSVERLQFEGSRWRVYGPGDAWAEEADILVIASALGSRSLSPVALPLQAVRGQITWGNAASVHGAAPFPVNGNGHFIPDVPHVGGRAWFCGSSYVRGDDRTDVRQEEQVQNLVKLRELLPGVAGDVEGNAAQPTLGGWAQVRCASHDRRPLVGELAPGLWLSTAMGSRGLTFALLCAEVIAARLHGEPLPLDAPLARAIDVARLGAR